MADILEKLRQNRAPKKKEDVRRPRNIIIHRSAAAAAPLREETAPIVATAGIPLNLRRFLVANAPQAGPPPPRGGPFTTADAVPPAKVGPFTTVLVEGPFTKVDEDNIGERPDIDKKAGPFTKEPQPAAAAPKGKKAAAAAAAAATRRKKEPAAAVAPAGDFMLGDLMLSERVPPPPAPPQPRAEGFFMNNRRLFFKTIRDLYQKYSAELRDNTASFSCDTIGQNTDFSLLTHQKIVFDYLNLTTPYRGILLYHGLGSGKTCTSIALAEGMKHQKKVFVMTPASLRANYIAELKKCGDVLYKKMQYWEFFPLSEPTKVAHIGQVMGIPTDYIKRARGIWVVNPQQQESNYNSLRDQDQQAIDKQLDVMIGAKYISISYNGLNARGYAKLQMEHGENPFHNSVIIIDEAHNFVSRIVNKLSLGRRGAGSLSLALYDAIMDAENARVILLSGTPIINYPNEIAVLFNLIRGYIKTYRFKLTKRAAEKKILNDTWIREIFAAANFGRGDYISFADNTLSITPNPFGFENVMGEATGEYKGVRLATEPSAAESFQKEIKSILEGTGAMTVQVLKPEKYLALEDDITKFMEIFISARGEFLNNEVFKKRVWGLTSYYRSAQEELLPRYTKKDNFHEVQVPMSDYQFLLYQKERKKEKEKLSKQQKQAKKKIEEKIPTTYRINSRLACNFVYPDFITPPTNRAEIDVPAPSAATEAGDEEPEILVTDEYVEEEISEKVEVPANQREIIERVYREMETRSEAIFSPDELAKYSPKYLAILQNIQNPAHQGLHLVYSQFRTFEGLGFFAMALRVNGFAQFKIVRRGEVWELEETEGDETKPKYAFFTGTESKEEKRIIKAIYNGDWSEVPQSLTNTLRARRLTDNNMGQIIKVLMITGAASEGINLRNTRYVHIMEPYWNNVRITQTIGRARRICSHKDLPEELRDVNVFLYLSRVTPEQKAGADKDLHIDIDEDTGQMESTDGFLYGIARLKERVSEQILRAVKETSFDCYIYKDVRNGESLSCFGVLPANNNNYTGDSLISLPDLRADLAESNPELNKQRREIKFKKLRVGSVEYAVDMTPVRAGIYYVYTLADYEAARENNQAIYPYGYFDEKKKKVFAGEPPTAAAEN